LTEVITKARVPHFVIDFDQVAIAVASPDLDCTPVILIGAAALILFPTSGIDGAAGGALPGINHKSILQSPIESPTRVQLVIVALNGKVI